MDLWQVAEWNHEYRKSALEKGPNSHRDCDGKLDEAAQAKFCAAPYPLDQSFGRSTQRRLL